MEEVRVSEDLKAIGNKVKVQYLAQVNIKQNAFYFNAIFQRSMCSPSVHVVHFNSLSSRSWVRFSAWCRRCRIMAGVRHGHVLRVQRHTAPGVGDGGSRFRSSHPTRPRHELCLSSAPVSRSEWASGGRAGKLSTAAHILNRSWLLGYWHSVKLNLGSPFQKGPGHCYMTKSNDEQRRLCSP